MEGSMGGSGGCGFGCEEGQHHLFSANLRGRSKQCATEVLSRQSLMHTSQLF
jgi:hypothetical protein